MNILEAIKITYSDSGDKAAVFDSSFKLVWKNTAAIPDDISLNDLLFDTDIQISLPIERDTVCRSKDGSAVKLRPLTDGEGPCGYLALFYDTETIHRLCCHSDKLKEQNVLLGNIRSGISDILITSNKMRVNPSFYSEEACTEIRRSVRQTLSSLTNTAFVSAAYSPGIKTELESISDGLTFIAEEIAPLIEGEKCRLLTDISPSVYALVNFKLFEAAVINLITNAFMYCTAPEKEIRLSLSRENAAALITVSDNGTSADLQRIEKLSHYSGREIEYRNCECLGLVLARQVCEQLGGSIAFSLSETGGLTAVMQIPCAAEDAPLGMRARKTHLAYMPFDPQLCILSKGLKDLGTD